MRIAVFCKWCPDPTGVELFDDRSVVVDPASWALGENDRVAVAMAMTVAARQGGDVVAVTAGPPEIDTLLARRSILSEGPDALYTVADQRLSGADAHQTARALVAAVRRIGGIDVVVCGSGSADLHSQQVGVQAAELLGWPVLNNVVGATLGTGTVQLVRRSAVGEDTVEAPLPFVMAVVGDTEFGRERVTGDARSPDERCIVWSLDDLGPGATARRSSEVLSTTPSTVQCRGRVRITGEPSEVAAELVDRLHVAGLLGVRA